MKDYSLCISYGRMLIESLVLYCCRDIGTSAVTNESVFPQRALHRSIRCGSSEAVAVRRWLQCSKPQAVL